MAEHLSLEYWNQRWQDGSTGWRNAENEPEGPPFADNVSFAEGALEQKVLCEGKSAFVPLCGDSNVVLYLAEQGMTVVGLDGSAIAVQQLKARVAEASEDVQKRVHLVEGDFYAFLPGSEMHLGSTAKNIKQFDFIYDRASFVAIDPARRDEYKSLMEAWTSPGAVYYFEAIQRKPSLVKEGPPHHTPYETVETHFPTWRVKLDPSCKDLPTEETEAPWLAYRAAMTKLEQK
eukprot:TRINITY_DN29009_c0_g1_i1.p1 TRINITY_DN29009_c0_g1~~TRINITY_DN29009_c0_g1_i1.p1  ORF type:complete len:251 (+),score=104.53 TRINITY_DN29009_c0_g1_i1:59-754(+)